MFLFALCHGRPFYQLTSSLFSPLTYNLDIRKCPKQCQDETARQLATPNVKLLSAETLTDTPGQLIYLDYYSGR